MELYLLFNVFHIARNLRGAPVNQFKTDFDFAPSSSLIHKDDAFIDIPEERPPTLSYMWEVCDPNTLQYLHRLDYFTTRIVRKDQGTY